MIQNLRYYCRQRIEAEKQISNANLAVYTKLGLTILLFRVQIKSHMIHFQI